MRLTGKLPRIFSLFLLAASLPAWAGSVNSFSNGFDTKTAWSFTPDTFTENHSLDSSPFDGGKVTNGHSGYFVSEEGFSGTTLLDGSDKHFFDRGWGHDGCDRRDDCNSVPEGGAPLSYLIFSGLAVIAGILISGKRHRATVTA